MIEIVAPIALYLIQAFLATMLVVAGAAKLADTHGFAGTLIGLGVPVRWGGLIRGLALAIPLLEVGLGIALATNAWPMIADLAVLALLSFFSVVTVVAVLKVPRVTCRCFGALSDSQFNGKGLARSPQVVALIALVYASAYGLIEAFGLPFRSPSLVWQVPAHWLNGRSAAVQTLIWGTTLGPGLVTRNPLAGIWLLPLLIAFNQSLLIAVLVGAAHAMARALGVLYNRRRIDGVYADLAILGSQMRWRYADGLALLMTAGVLIAYALWRT